MNMSPWRLILIGLALLFFGVYNFHSLAQLENSDGSLRVTRYVAFLYELGGKWTVGGFLCTLGLIFCGLGVRGWVRQSTDPDDTEDE
jgi:hypothetical protein